MSELVSKIQTVSKAIEEGFDSKFPRQYAWDSLFKQAKKIHARWEKAASNPKKQEKLDDKLDDKIYDMFRLNGGGFTASINPASILGGLTVFRGYPRYFEHACKAMLDMSGAWYYEGELHRELAPQLYDILLEVAPDYLVPESASHPVFVGLRNMFEGAQYAETLQEHRYKIADFIFTHEPRHYLFSADEEFSPDMLILFKSNAAEGIFPTFLRKMIERGYDFDIDIINNIAKECREHRSSYNTSNTSQKLQILDIGLDMLPVCQQNIEADDDARIYLAVKNLVQQAALSLNDQATLQSIARNSDAQRHLATLRQLDQSGLFDGSLADYVENRMTIKKLKENALQKVEQQHGKPMDKLTLRSGFNQNADGASTNQTPAPSTGGQTTGPDKEGPTLDNV